MGKSCPHCGSPSRLNPCWYRVTVAKGSPAWGGDPPCIGDQYDEDHSSHERSVWIGAILVVGIIIGGLFLIGYFAR